MISPWMFQEHATIRIIAQNSMNHEVLFMVSLSEKKLSCDTWPIAHSFVFSNNIEKLNEHIKSTVVQNYHNNIKF